MTFILFSIKKQKRDYRNGVFCCEPLKVSRHGDLSVDQGLHHPADQLVERPRHVLTQFALKAALHIIPDHMREK